MTWPEDGRRYTGEFVNGQPEGQGKMVYKDGSSFEGQWVSGVRSGSGKMIDADGNIYEGEFSNGKPNGQRKMKHPDGSFFEGTFVDGQPVIPPPEVVMEPAGTVAAADVQKDSSGKMTTAAETAPLPADNPEPAVNNTPGEIREEILLMEREPVAAPKSNQLFFDNQNIEH